MLKETLDPHNVQLEINVKLNSTPFLKVHYKNAVVLCRVSFSLKNENMDYNTWPL